MTDDNGAGDAAAGQDDGAQEWVAHLEREVERLQLSVKALTDTNQKLEATNLANSTELDALRNKVKRLEEDAKAQEEEINKVDVVRAELEDTASERDVLESTLTDLTQQLQQARQRIEAATTSRQEQDTRVQEEVATARKILQQEMQQKMEKAQQEQALLEAMVQELQVNLEAAEQEKSAAVKQLESKMAGVRKSVLADQSTLRNEIIDLKSQIDELQTKNARLEEGNGKLENSVVAYKAQVAEFEEQIEHLLVRNKQLSKGVDPVIKEKEELAHRLSEVEQERDEYLQQYEEMQAQTDKHNQQLMELSRQRDQVQQELEAAKTTAKETQEQLTQATRERSELQASLIDVRADLNKTETIRNNIAAKHQEVNTLLRNSKKQNAELQAAVSTLSERSGKLATGLKEEQAKARDLRAQTQAERTLWSRKLQKLKARVETLTEDYNTLMVDRNELAAQYTSLAQRFHDATGVTVAGAPPAPVSSSAGAMDSGSDAGSIISITSMGGRKKRIRRKKKAGSSRKRTAKTKTDSSRLAFKPSLAQKSKKSSAQEAARRSRAVAMVRDTLMGKTPNSTGKAGSRLRRPGKTGLGGSAPGSRGSSRRGSATSGSATPTRHTGAGGGAMPRKGLSSAKHRATKHKKHKASKPASAGVADTSTSTAAAAAAATVVVLGAQAEHSEESDTDEDVGNRPSTPTRVEVEKKQPDTAPAAGTGTVTVLGGTTDQSGAVPGGATLPPDDKSIATAEDDRDDSIFDIHGDDDDLPSMFSVSDADLERDVSMLTIGSEDGVSNSQNETEASVSASSASASRHRGVSQTPLVAGMGDPVATRSRMISQTPLVSTGSPALPGAAHPSFARIPSELELDTNPKRGGTLPLPKKDKAANGAHRKTGSASIPKPKGKLPAPSALFGLKKPTGSFGFRAKSSGKKVAKSSKRTAKPSKTRSRATHKKKPSYRSSSLPRPQSSRGKPSGKLKEPSSGKLTRSGSKGRLSRPKSNKSSPQRPKRGSSSKLKPRHLHNGSIHGSFDLDIGRTRSRSSSYDSLPGALRGSKSTSSLKQSNGTEQNSKQSFAARRRRAASAVSRTAFLKKAPTQRRTSYDTESLDAPDLSISGISPPGTPGSRNPRRLLRSATDMSAVEKLAARRKGGLAAVRSASTEAVSSSDSQAPVSKSKSFGFGFRKSASGSTSTTTAPAATAVNKTKKPTKVSSLTSLRARFGFGGTKK